MTDTERNKTMATLEAWVATSNTSLADLKALADLQIARQSEVSRLEQLLAEAKKSLNEIQLVKLPTEMIAAGVPKFSLSDGREVSVRTELTVSLPKARKLDILAKIRDMGHESLISQIVTIDAGKTAKEHVAHVLEYADTNGIKAEKTEDVNTASFKKVLSDRMNAGISDDLAFFGAYVVTKANIK